MKVQKILGYLLGFCLLITAIACGFSQFPQWTVLFLGMLFTAAYINNKWTVWKELVQRDLSSSDHRFPLRNFYQALGATYLIETTIVFAFYWLGRGISGLL
ncbi:hypothetical protein S7335_2126 [Synechococcus sp. PCC 7335]|uniref:hypothetical protein n=1 Tax=Synechococcus sp. (strain ATCC 29403 / PCC 7335) TaxID=91464 RepID=UPI00017EBC6B|nr:hypothetical protein [Synechococcus sp. PCC 7335]EDX84429.1 hypothetical protein S7335_2126 [Synechococcus sp. PCC 7335]